MCKICYLRAKLMVNDSVIDKTFGSKHQSVMTQIKNPATDG